MEEEREKRDDENGKESLSIILYISYKIHKGAADTDTSTQVLSLSLCVYVCLSFLVSFSLPLLT